MFELLAPDTHLQRDIPVMHEFVFGLGETPYRHQRKLAQLRVELSAIAKFPSEGIEAAEQIRRIGQGPKDITDRRPTAFSADTVEQFTILLWQIFAIEIRKSRSHSDLPRSSIPL